jgi:hypothetical protein
MQLEDVLLILIHVNIVNNASSWWKTSDSLNLEAFNEGLEMSLHDFDDWSWKSYPKCYRGLYTCGHCIKRLLSGFHFFMPFSFVSYS